MKTAILSGWGIRVDGPKPYLAWEFERTKNSIECQWNKRYHRPVKVVLVPLGEWTKLINRAKRVK